MGTARTKRDKNTIQELLEFAGVPQEVINEFGTAGDAGHPALKQAARAKAEAERREAEADNGGMEPPKDYAEEEGEDKVFDKKSLPYGGNAWPGLTRDEDEPENDAERLDRNNERAAEVDELMQRSEPELDRQTNYDAPPRDDGDDSYDQEEEMSYENEEEDWQEDYADDTGASATCPKCGSSEVGSGGGRALKDRVMAQHHECNDCGHKGQWQGPDAGLAQQKYGDPNKSESEENTFDFATAVKEARQQIEKDKKETIQQAATRRHGDKPIVKDKGKPSDVGRAFMTDRRK